MPGRTPGEAEKGRRSSTAATARLNGGVAEGAKGPPLAGGGLTVRRKPLCADAYSAPRNPSTANASQLGRELTNGGIF